MLLLLLHHVHLLHHLGVQIRVSHLLAWLGFRHGHGHPSAKWTWFLALRRLGEHGLLHHSLVALVLLLLEPYLVQRLLIHGLLLLLYWETETHN